MLKTRMPRKAYPLIALAFILWGPIVAQNNLAEKLKGTWKVEGAEVYEDWQVINPSAIKGISYQHEATQIKVMEYLDLTYSRGVWVYQAQVLGQNKGEAIPFKQIKSDTSLCFENRKHDFPSRICYQFVSDTQLVVRLDGNQRKTVALVMNKLMSRGPALSGGQNPNYDEVLAERLGSDDYGMKPYVLVMLRSGENNTVSSELRQELFRGHLQNIGQLVDEGKLIVAGPLGPNQWGYRGVFILDAADMAEAQIMLQTDPAIRSGLLAADLLPWYGSAALPEYLPVSEKIWKIKP